MFSRHGPHLTRAFADIADDAVQTIPNAMIDGELLAVLPDGGLSFARLQTRAGEGSRPEQPFTVMAIAFGCLSDGDLDLRHLLLDQGTATFSA